MKAVIFFFLFPLQVLAQDLAGIWTGYIETGGNKLPFEIVVSGQGEKLTGYAMTIFTFNGIENIGVKSIKLRNKKGSVFIEDEKLVYDNYTTPPKRIKFFADLFLRSSDSLLVLSGNYSTRTMDFRADNTSYVGVVRLQKQKGFAPTRLTTKLEELDLLSELSFMQPSLKNKEPAAVIKEKKKGASSTEKETVVVKKETHTIAKQKQTDNKESTKSTIEPIKKPAEAVAERKTDVIQTVSFLNDSLVLSLYDNGEIDGDTVSVVLNNKVIVDKKALTASAIKTIIPTKGLADSLQLILYAENLGRIPPNTGLLVIQDGTERYEIRFAGDLQKNSAIILKRK